MNAPRWTPRRRFVPRGTSKPVHRGFEVVGSISLSGRVWLAFDIEGRALGTFQSRLEATAAVLHEDRGRP
jgi:hypothetical protein